MLYEIKRIRRDRMKESQYRERMCTRKVIYRTKKKAIYGLAQLKRVKKLLPPTLKVYLCKCCNFYHLGNDKT